jgi:hypothetical protein
MMEKEKSNVIKDKIMKNVLGVAITGLVGMSMLGAGSVSAASTEKTSVSGGLIGGPLEITGPPSTVTFPDTTLNGDVQTVKTHAGSMGITDASGLGAGYRVTAQATQFTEVEPPGGFESGTSAKSFPSGVLTLSSSEGSITKDSGSTSPLPSFTSSSWVIDNGTTHNVVSADKNEGMGKFNIDFGPDSLSLLLEPTYARVDKDNYPSGATPYQTEITYTIVTGP